VEEKVALVEEHRDTYGLNRCLKALGLSRGTWHYQRHSKPERRTKDEVLKERIVKVIKEHPGYGYRRIQRELAEQRGEPVNHKRLRRVLKSYELGLRRCLPRSKPSEVGKLVATAGRSADLIKGRSFEVLEAFSTDFKELLYDGGRKKAHLMVLLDLKSRWAGGFAVGGARNRCVALEALDNLRSAMAVMSCGLCGVVIHHDKDSVYTSYRWLEELLLKERARVSYAQRGARDNPWIESFWGRFETENGELIVQAETLKEVKTIVEEQLGYYNHVRRHSGLDYRRPYEVMLAATTGEDMPPEL
jgi:transposase InsO family protein